MANSLVEDPGIPLVGTPRSKFPCYNASISNASSAEQVADDQAGSGSAEGKREPTGASCRGWGEMTSGGWRKFSNISYRLSRRKNLLRRRRHLVDVGCLLASFGVVFMMLEAELFVRGYVSKEDPLSVFLKLVVSISTLFLLVSILAYHVAGAQLSMVDNSFEDWRLVVRFRFIVCVFLELAVCAVHPPPGDLGVTVDPAVESVLSVLMFLRLYLMARFFVVHSYLVSDPATQSLGALNKVRIDAMFVFKALMTEYPGSALLSLMAATFFVSSWSVHACESYTFVVNNQYGNNTEGSPGRFFQQAMWFSAITFLTIGYGDVTPESKCGRVLAVATGLLGVGTTALLVAVLAQKLEQSRAEKYVHAFVSRMRLDKIRKNAAANVIKNAVKLWRMRMPSDSGATIRRKIRVHGKLIQAVSEMREARAAKVNIGEAAVGVIEVHTAIEGVLKVAEDISEQQVHLVERTDHMGARLAAIESKLDALAASFRH